MYLDHTFPKNPTLPQHEHAFDIIWQWNEQRKRYTIQYSKLFEQFGVKQISLILGVKYNSKKN